MSDLVGISSGAVQAYQRALGVVSNNIANVGTEGYTRQVSDLAATAPRRVGQAFLGTGVEFQAIRRSVDEFVQQNMRNSNSDLAAQSPMVDYASRVVDVLGSEDSGLTGALNKFFNTARDLSVDPSSVLLRSAFLTAAEGVAGRFNGLAGSLQAVAEELGEYAASASAEFNSLTKQLALVNSQLSQKNTIERQPPTLLDQRDLLLQKLSALARVKVEAAANGELTISVSDSMTKGVVLSGQSAKDILLKPDPANPLRLNALLDPYGTKEAIPSLGSGELGGILAFQDQVLEPLVSGLGALAAAFANEVNSVHTDAIDGRGDLGGNLFGFTSGQTDPAAAIHVVIDDPVKVAAASLFRASVGAGNTGGAAISWNFSNLDDGQRNPESIFSKFAADSTSSQSISVAPGQTLAGVTTLPPGVGEATIYLDEADSGQRLQLITSDGLHLLGSELNPLEQAVLLSQKPAWMNPTVSYDSNSLGAGSSANHLGVSLFLGSKSEPMAVPAFAPDGSPIDNALLPAKIASGPIAAGLTGSIVAAGDLSINGIPLGALDVPTGQTLQASNVAAWINAAARNTLVSGTGAQSILASEIDLTKNFEVKGAGAYPAGIDFPDGETEFADLAELVALINKHSDLTKVAASTTISGGLTYLNLAGLAGYEDATISFTSNPSGVDGLSAQSVNNQKFETTSLDLTKDLTLNAESGTAVTLPGSATQTRSEFIAAINAAAGTTGVVAWLDEFDTLVLSTSDAFQGEDITIGPDDDVASGLPTNALGVSAGVLKAQLVVTRPSDAALRPDETSAAIRLGIEQAGTPALLNQLGFRAAAYVSGTSSADLLLMVTGEGKASVEAEFTAEDFSPRDYARSHPIELVFTSMERYQVYDRVTGQLVSTRTFNPHANPLQVQFGGLELTLSAPPAAGDRFTVDGNDGGVGDNGAILKLVELQDKKVIGSGATFDQSYVEQVASIGNLLNQARVSQLALEVAYEQAIEANQASSGVSLDEEAADLIRYQQAYQASAKVMQTASALFDSILQAG